MVGNGLSFGKGLPRLALGLFVTLVVALGLVCGLTSGEALGGEELPLQAQGTPEYNLWVGDVKVTGATSGEGWSFAPAEGQSPATLKLDRASIRTGHAFVDADTSYSYGIYYKGTDLLTIAVASDSAVDVSSEEENVVTGIFCECPGLTITGEGKLTVKGVNEGISGSNDVTIDKGVVDATGLGSAIIANWGDVVITNDSTVEATGSIDGKNVKIDDGTVNAVGGISASNNSVTINGGEVTATATATDSDGIVARGTNDSPGTVTITGGIVIAKGGDNGSGIYAHKCYGLEQPGKVTITGGTVIATGGAEGCGIYTEESADPQEPGTVTISRDTTSVTASGGKQAIEGIVTNAVAGMGWTDAAGTQDKTAIEAKADGQDLSAYKKVQFPPPMAKVTTTPKATNPTYNGKAQELVTAGTAEGGTMQYSLDGETWSEKVPTGTDVKSYTVWYKVVGDNQHADSEAQSVTSVISKKKDPASAKVTYVATGKDYKWTKGSKVGLDVTFKRIAKGETTDTAFSHFRSASVDGKALTEKDDYTKAEGSVVVTLTPSYLNTLSDGEHTLTATFDDGSAEAKFTVAEAGSADTVTFKFDANGGTGTMDPMVVKRGENVKLTANAFKRPGYIFDGWNLAADGSGQSYKDGQTVIASFDGTLYAQWKRDGYPAPSMENSRDGKLTSASEVITYKVYQGVPDYAKSFVTWVDLEDVLRFSSDDVTVTTSDDTVVGSDVAKVAIDGQRLTVTVDDATTLLGKTLRVSYKAELADGADLSPYMNAAGTIASVPYQAHTTFDGNASDVKSSKVEYVKYRVSKSATSSTGSTSSTSRSSTAGKTSTLAKTGDPASLAGVVAMALAGAGTVLAGRRRRR